MNQNNKNTEKEDPWEIDIQSCSSMDCTGLIPSLPQSEAELESYEELYPYIAQAKNRVRKGTSSQDL